MKKLRLIATSVLAAASFIFFFAGYRYHLLECESSKLFLFTGDYFCETVLCRGGFCNYISAFLIQFYHLPVVGAAIIAILLAALQWGLAQVCKNDYLYPFTFVPSLFYWVLLCNNNYTLNGLVAMVAAIMTCSMLRKSSHRFAAVPSLFGSQCLRSILYVIIAACAIIVFIYLFAGRFFLYAEAPVWVFIILWGTAAVVLLLGILLPERRAKALLTIALLAVVFAAGGTAIWKNYNSLDEEIFRYAYLARNREWGKIEQCALKKALASPVSTNALNLALACKGTMGEKLFTFFQKGERSLINFEEREVSAEILLNLGFINEAQHITFEAMAGNPDLQRGAFHLLRLAQTNMIAGRRAVAHKYCKTLSRTIFYRRAAVELMAMSEEEISAHPLYGQLRRMQPTVPFRFDASDFEGMLEIMVAQHPDNTLAGEYLNASYLLTKNLKAFEERLPELKKPLAKHYMEAYSMISVLKGGAAASAELQNYITAYNNCGGNPGRMKRFSGTYWFYYNFIR